jgi:SAM-dependent methyltransferase
VRRWASAAPRGRALDVATGLGRNAIFLAKAGFHVDAVDISSTCLMEAARRARRARVGVTWIEADLDRYRVPPARYSLVVNAFFLKRRLIPVLQRAVRPGGVLIFETHLAGDESQGPRRGPSQPSRRLRRGELRRRFRGWEILELEEGEFREAGGDLLVGRIVARRPRRLRGAP